MKYPQEKISDLQNTIKKTLCNNEIPTRKNFKPTKYPQEKISEQNITHNKKFLNYQIPLR